MANKAQRVFVLVLFLGFLVSSVLLVVRWQVSAPSAYAVNLGDKGVTADHFYPPEQGGGVGFRWSRELSALSLPALGMRQTLTVTLNPARPASSAPVHVKLIVNGTTASEFEAQPGWQTYTATIGSALYPDSRIFIESDTFYPSASDRRILGVAVTGVGVSPAAGRLGVLPPLLYFLLAAFSLLTVGLVKPFLSGARLRAAVVAASLAVPLLSFLPSGWALPAAAWLVGLLLGASLLARASLWLLPGAWLRTKLESLAGSRWELPSVALLVAVLSLAMTWPLAARIKDSMPGWPADNFAFLYKFWWFRTALLHLHVQPFFDPNTFAPFGFNLGQGEPTLINTLPAVALGALFNDVVAYNLLALASFVVAGLSAYLLVREVSGSKWGALLATLVFAFCPYRMSQFAGHIQLLGTGWIALAFYFTERSLRGHRLRDGALAGASLALAALSAWYYAYMVGLLLVVYLVARLLTARGTIDFRRLAAPGAAALLALAVLAGPVALPSLLLWGRGGLSHSAKAADEHSAAPIDYAIPNELQPVWGQPSMSLHANQNVIESSLYLGLVAVVVAGVGWALLRKRREGNVAGAWLLLLVTAVVLSLGLSLHWLNGQVVTSGGGSIPLPGRLLYDWLPLFSSMRAYARFGVIAVLALAVLLGMGWRGIAVRFPRREAWLALLAGVLIMADFWTGPYSWGTTTVAETRTQAFVASLPPGNVMQMPLTSALTGPALFAETFYGKPIAYGYDTFEPPEWSAARPRLVRFPDDASLDTLRGWNVRYIVVSATAYGADWPGTLDFLKSLPRLRYLNSFEESRTWDVDPRVIDARPDMEEYLMPDKTAVFDLVR